MKILIAQPLYLLFLLSVPAALLIFRLFTARAPNRTRTPPTGKPKPDARAVASLAIRSLILALLTLSLSRVSTAVGIDRVNVLYLLDVSSSLDSLTRRIALDGVERSVQGMGESDAAGVLAFGKNASMEIAPGGAGQAALTRITEDISLESDIDGSATDISAAINLGIAAFPEQGSKRILLISDGNETRGDALEAARTAKAYGVEIYPVPVSSAMGENEVFVTDILAPGEVRSGQVHDFTVLVQSLAPGTAVLSLFQDGVYVGEDRAALQAGENSFTYRGSFERPGLHRYEVVVTSPDDSIDENNRYEVFLQVTGKPSVLYVSQRAKEAAAFIQALETQGIRTVRISSEGIPNTLAGLLEYDAVILDNVPGFDLSLSKMEILERYVRDTGGGLLMVGGDKSFGLGGYYQTPVEKLLPVDVDVASSAKVPSLTLVMVVDKSGSMGGFTQGGETKLDLVKNAALSAVELLNPFYRVGLLAFDADTRWTVPITSAGRRDEIAELLYGLTAGGGTDLYEAMQEGYRAIAESESAVKHLIVLTDGLTEPGDFQALTESMHAEKITVSSVAVGEDSDRALLQEIAQWGGGRYYYTDHIEDVPRIFASEAIIVSRGLLVEEPFVPRLADPHEIVAGLDLSGLPVLEGFVLTYPKADAQMVLAAGEGEPLLIVRRYGLGRSAAFTSDFRARWGTRWITWPLFPQLTAQLTRWLQRPSPARELTTDLRTDEGNLVIDVDAEDGEGRFLNFLELGASIVLPEGEVRELEIPQVAPGRYQASLEAETGGPYIATIHGLNASSRLLPQTHGLIVPYAREYRKFDPDIGLLEQLAAATGGKMMDINDAQGLQDIYSNPDSQWLSVRDIGIWLILAAALLLAAEIAARRLVLPAGFFRRILRKLSPFQRAGRKIPDLDEISRLMEERQQAEREERAKRDIGFWYARKGRR